MQVDILPRLSQKLHDEISVGSLATLSSVTSYIQSRILNLVDQNLWEAEWDKSC